MFLNHLDLDGSNDGVGTLISLTDAKAHLNIDGTNDDERLDLYLQAATEYIERKCDASFTYQGWQYVNRYFPCSLPKPPVVEVISVEYYSDDVLTLLDSDEYRWYSSRHLTLIEPVTAWPTPDDRMDAIIIEYAAGNFIPDTAKHLCRLAMAALNEQRGDTVDTDKVLSGLDPVIAMLQHGKYH